MSLLPKISRLQKIPEMLKHKQEEEEARKKRKEKDRKRQEQQQFILDEVTISQSSKDQLKVNPPPFKPVAMKGPDKKEEGIGVKLDLRI